MSKIKQILIFGALIAIGLMVATGTASAANLKTLDNLQEAFNGESNANAKYTAFAVKADEEGYHQVASLFRAAAASEKVHFESHAKVIQALGAEPKAVIALPEIKSTAENLKAAFDGETYESSKMYPDFIKVANEEGQKDAAMSFKGALAAETEHTKFYNQASNDLENWREGKKTFIVCLKCGYTTITLDIKQCPVCSFPRSKMIEVS